MIYAKPMQLYSVHLANSTTGAHQADRVLVATNNPNNLRELAMHAFIRTSGERFKKDWDLLGKVELIGKIHVHDTSS